MKKSFLLYQGKAAQARGAGRFAKDILRTGRWTHPVTGQEVVVDGARLEKLAQNSNRYLRNVDRERIPFPDGHSFAADKNLGWWPGPFFVLDDKLFSVVEPTDAATTKKMEDGSIAAVSAMIEFGRADAHGNTYDEVITHVCATPYPVIDGQQDFVKLSADTTEGDLFIPQELAGTSPDGNRNRTEGRMDLKKMAKALGLPEDTPAEKVMEAAEKAAAAASKLSAVESEKTVISTALKAQGLEFKDGKVVKLSNEQLDTTVKPGDSEEVKKLKAKIADQDTRLNSQDQRLDTLDETGKKKFVEDAKRMALEHVQAGRIPPALQAAVTEVLSIQGEVQALSLASDGKSAEKAINLVDRLQTLLKSLPSIKGTALSQHGGAAGETKESEDRRSKAREIAARVGGKKLEKEPAGTK